VPNTLNEYPLLTAMMRIPRVGPWTGEVEFRAETAYTGDVVITIDDVEFSGFIEDDGAALNGANRVAAKVTGGAGGLDTELAAKQYVAPLVSAVLDDIMRESGETLSGDVDSAITSKSLTTWQRAAGNAKQALAALATSLGVTWRVLLDGTIWFGQDTFETVEPEHRLLDNDQSTGTATTSLIASLLPGTTFLGLRLEQVNHTIGPKDARTEASRTSPAAAMRAFLGPVEQRIQYSRAYSARVVKQNADGTLQVLPDDPVFKGAGVDQVKIRLGVPGTCTVPKGARCEICFSGGDPQKPRAVAFHDGSLTELKLGSGADYVALAAKVLSDLQTIKTDFDKHVHPTGMGPSGPPTIPMTDPASVAADKVKAE
jgi:hypothetical protein